ncbi:PREDICTED: uncharacterized protein LOC108557288 isoform X2 [Nicrophorus vespilloides]|uniref:Regulatory protein zeste n=1 Tax=Nicrophorus vespilloides TaxID=110193 RepID=A0ABM1M3S7_NICVS|nr:PREDICTED: uncharacterized protein LOC108557288 isoform X2 [Nicrophorus vespilloides]
MMKRKRSYNFEQSENNLLIDLCLDHKDVIENTETSDVAVLRQQSETWIKIMNIFNERSGKHPRTVEALQTKHEDNKEYYKQYAEHEQKLLAIFNNSSLEPVVDSDMQFKQLVVETTHDENEHSDISEITPKALVNSFMDNKDNTTETDEESSNPENVSSNKPGKSCNVPEQNGDGQARLSDLADRKSELVALQIEIMKQELQSKENDEKRKRELHKYDLLLVQQRIENEKNDARRRSELHGFQLEKEKLELLLF